MLELSYPFEKGGSSFLPLLCTHWTSGTGLALRLEPDWLCHGVALGKYLNCSAPQFPHQEKKKE